MSLESTLERIAVALESLVEAKQVEPAKKSKAVKAATIATEQVISTETQVLENVASAAPTVSVSDGGRVDWRSTGGITTLLNVYDQGVCDFSGNGQAKTVAACNVYNGGTLLDPLGIVTWTAGVDNPGGRLGKATLDLGLNKSYAVSAI